MAIRNRLFPLVRCCGAGPFWPASFWTTVFKNNVTTPHIPLERIILFLSISFALTYVSKLTTKNVSRRSCSFLFHLRRSRTFKPALAKKTRFRPAPQHYPKPNLVHFLMRFMKIICHLHFHFSAAKMHFIERKKPEIKTNFNTIPFPFLFITISYRITFKNCSYRPPSCQLKIKRQLQFFLFPV